MARLLSSQRLAEIRRRWEANMPETCTVLPRTTYRLPGAAEDFTYPDPAVDDLAGLVTFKCRWKPTDAASSVALDREQGVVQGVLQCPVRTRVVPTDRLYVRGRDASGRSWSVILEPHAPTGPRTWEAVREIPCVLVVGG